MTYQTSTLGPRLPLLPFSETQERAVLLDHTAPRQKKSRRDASTSSIESQMPSTNRRRRTRRRRGGGSGRKLKGGHRLKGGKISLRIAGYGLQKLGASQLVRFVPLSKLKVIGKKILRASGYVKKRKGGGGRKKKRSGRKRRRRRRRRTAT